MNATSESTKMPPRGEQAAGRQASAREALAVPNSINNGHVVNRDALRDALAREREALSAWQFFTLADAFKPRPRVQYLIHNIFSEASLNIVFGLPGALKTMLMLDAAIAIAAGQAWLPPLPKTPGTAFAVTRATVLIVDFDSGRRRLHERIEALARGRGLSAGSDAQVFYTSMPSPWLVASERDSIGDLARYITDRGARFVVLDNLAAISGGVDENSSEMVRVMSNLRWLTEETGACINVIHHPRKSTGEARTNGEALRGHSSINAAIDLALLVEREGSSRMIDVRSTKTRDVDVKPFGAEFSFTHRPGTTELETAIFFGVTSQDDESDYAIERAILSVAHKPLNASQIVAEVKRLIPTAGQNRIRRLAESAASRGLLNTTPGEHGAKLYQVP